MHPEVQYHSLECNILCGTEAEGLGGAKYYNDNEAITAAEVSI